MILLGSAAREAIDRIRADDRGAALALEAAAAAHLGRAPREPVIVAARVRRRPTASEGAAIVAVAPLDRTAAVVEVGGVRVTSLERTIVDLLERPTQSGAPALVARLMTTPSAIEHRGLDAARLAERAARHGKAVVRRRIAWMLARAGHEHLASVLVRGARGGVLALDPRGPAGGPTVAPYRLRLNAPDGFDDPRGDVAALLATHARASLGPAAIDLGLLVVAGVSLERAVAAAGRRAAVASAVDGAADAGLLDRAGGCAAPCAPFDRACVAIVRTAPPALRTRRARALAEVLARGESVDERVDGVLVMHAAGDRADAQRRLRAIAPDAAASLDAARAVKLLGVCGDERAHRPLRLALLERLGRWDEALREARAGLDARDADAPRHRLRAARAAWALGQHRACDAELRALERLGAAVDAGVRADAGLLRATLATERGDHARAGRLLREVLQGAERAGDARARARALHRLGTLEARRGRLVEASAFYRAALEVLPSAAPDAPSLAAVLRSNLAATALWLGRWEEAEALGARALEEKRRSGTLGAITITRVLLARIGRARGAPAVRGQAAELVDAAEQSGDLRLRVEAWLDLAEELARDGATAAAVAAHERARTALALLGGAEPVLDAMATHVEGLVRALGGDAEGGVADMDRAARSFAALDGPFWAARAGRDAASACEAAGDPKGALARYERVVVACARSRFVLGEDHHHAALYALAALEGGGDAREAAARALDALGPAEVRRRLASAGRRTLAAALAARRVAAPRPDDVAIVRGADGARFVDARERARILLGAPQILVLDEVGPALVRSDGVRVSLARRRVVAPLLEALAARAGEPVGAAALARDVWGRRDGASARAAIKMSIARLRAMLGPDRGAIAVARAGHALAYAWSDRYELRRLGPIPRGDRG